MSIIRFYCHPKCFEISKVCVKSSLTTQATIMYNKLIRHHKVWLPANCSNKTTKVRFFPHCAKMCVCMVHGCRRLLANGCAPGRFHSPADKIYESECATLCEYEFSERAPEPSNPTQPASVWVITLSGTVTLQLRQSKVACIYYTAGTNTQWMRYDGGRHSAHSPSMENCALAALCHLLAAPPSEPVCAKRRSRELFAHSLLTFMIRKPARSQEWAKRIP